MNKQRGSRSVSIGAVRSGSEGSAILDNIDHYHIDTSLYNSSRTLSSSSSMVSTPSNRKANRNLPKTITNKVTLNARLVKGKLLNLQSSKKYRPPHDAARHYRDDTDDSHPNKIVPGFMIHKPINTSAYDYGAFTNYPSGIDLQHGDNLPPAVKESQIRAWESAERVSAGVIFGEDDEEDDDEEETNNPIIKSIPGYTSSELGVVTQLHDEFKTQRHPITEENLVNREHEETRMLYELKKKHQAQNERVFQKSSSLTQRRQVQIGQKKDLLRRVFGYQNSLNVDYITNNSSYSTLDSAANVQKTFHEDKEEIACLVDEDQAFAMLLEETSERHKSQNAFTDDMEETKNAKDLAKTFDYGRFQHIVTTKLNKIYSEQIKEDFLDSEEEDYFNNDEELNTEMQMFSMSYLRRCVKEEA